MNTRLWTSQQSGNQDLFEEASFDVRTGACIHSASMWENEIPVEPREIASGVVLDGRDRAALDHEQAGQGAVLDRAQARRMKKGP